MSVCDQSEQVAQTVLKDVRRSGLSDTGKRYDMAHMFAQYAESAVARAIKGFAAQMHAPGGIQFCHSPPGKDQVAGQPQPSVAELGIEAPTQMHVGQCPALELGIVASPQMPFGQRFFSELSLVASPQDLSIVAAPQQHVGHHPAPHLPIVVSPPEHASQPLSTGDSDQKPAVDARSGTESKMSVADVANAIHDAYTRQKATRKANAIPKEAVASATMKKPAAAPGRCPPGPKMKLPVIAHEKSRYHYLVRLRDLAANDKPKSKTFSYERQNSQSMKRAREQAVNFCVETCRDRGVAIDEGQKFI